ncbi:MAG: hypothetical protein JXQ99_17795 [Hyphomicrobiaceae bacterium]
MTMQAMKSAEWDHATGVARQVCARVFRDGGAPSDALDAFGLAHEDLHGNWRMAVERIAEALCQSGTAKNQPQAYKMAA